MGHSHCILKEWQAKEVLQHLYRQHKSIRKLASLLDVSKSTLHRCLKGKQPIPASLKVRLCGLLPEEEEELLHVLKGKDLLAWYGLLDSNSNINKVVAFAIIDALIQN